MSEMEKEELKTRISGMTKEEQLLALNAIPFEIVWGHVAQRVLKMNDDLNMIVNCIVNNLKEEEK